MMFILVLKGSKSREIAVMLPYHVLFWSTELFNTVTHLRFLLKNMTLFYWVLRANTRSYYLLILNFGVIRKCLLY